jgi:hypothetical protein
MRPARGGNTQSRCTMGANVAQCRDVVFSKGVGNGAQEIAARQFKQASTNAAISAHMHVSIAV